MERFSVNFEAQLEDNTLAGYAHVFGYVAQRANYYTKVKPGAFDKVIDESDTLALFNHDRNFVLGRKTSGTLRLDSDKRGLAFELDLPETQLGKDVKELVKRGDLTGMSFGVTFNPKDHIDYALASDGREVRTFTGFSELIDVSVVTVPAFDGTEVMLNSKEDEELMRPPHGRSQLLRARIRAAQITRRV